MGITWNNLPNSFIACGRAWIRRPGAAQMSRSCYSRVPLMSQSAPVTVMFHDVSVIGHLILGQKGTDVHLQLSTKPIPLWNAGLSIRCCPADSQILLPCGALSIRSGIRHGRVLRGHKSLDGRRRTDERATYRLPQAGLPVDMFSKDSSRTKHSTFGCVPVPVMA